MALEFTDANFQETVLDAPEVSVVDFWAEWCGPCKMVGPIIDELASEYEGKAKIGKVNVDHNPEITQKYRVMNIPTILFIKNGEVIDKHVGAASKSALEAKLKSHLS